MNSKAIAISFVVTLFICTFFSACYPCRKIKVDAQIVSLKQAYRGEDSLFSRAQTLLQDKLANNSIDSSIAARVSRTLDELRKPVAEVNGKLSALEQLASTKKSFRENFRRVLVVDLPSLHEFVSITDSSAKAGRMERINMVINLLENAKQNMFNLAAFFGPGQYEIAAENLIAIESSFAPLLDSVANFSNRYQNIDRDVLLSFYGYADGQGIDPGSNLGNLLAQKGNLVNPTSPQLNEVLSGLRAKAMNDAFKNLYTKKIHQFQKTDKMLLIDVIRGMGERLPNPNIKDYQANDERRRIVLFYWGVIPR